MSMERTAYPDDVTQRQIGRPVSAFSHRFCFNNNHDDGDSAGPEVQGTAIEVSGREIWPDAEKALRQRSVLGTSGHHQGDRFSSFRTDTC